MDTRGDSHVFYSRKVTLAISKLLLLSSRFDTILQVNQVLGWEPKPYYNITEVREHSTMPRLLKEKIGEYMTINLE